MLEHTEDTLVILPVAHNGETIRIWNDCLVQFPSRETNNLLEVSILPVRGAKVTIRTVGESDQFEFESKRASEIVLSSQKRHTIFSGGVTCQDTYHTDFDFDACSLKSPETDRQDAGQVSELKTRVPRK